MYRPRVIPVVLIDENGQAVKTIKFKRRVDLGDPINTVSIFNALRVDELVLLDIDATLNNRRIPQRLLESIASEALMPFSVGGGIKNLDDIRSYLSSGAEKVILSSSALEKPTFLKQASDKFGASSIIVCIDVKTDFWGRQHVMICSNKRKTALSPVEAAVLMEAEGAGEIIIQNINQDGSMNGYDLNLIQSVSDAVGVPVIALGGAGGLHHIKQACDHTNSSAYAGGSMFCFKDEQRGVLISYPTKEQLLSLHQ